MPCTTILAGKNATYDHSTMIARNDDSGSGHFTPKKFVSVGPEDMPGVYTSVLSHLRIELPADPLRFTAVPNALPGQGIWAASGVNSANIAMTATETLTSNPRVLGADPLVTNQPAAGSQPERPGGIGEEDMVYLVLPFIHSAREGVQRLGQLLETYGTYEMNGIAFQDLEEIWWLETIGGHHWIARRVPDDCYAVMPNQLGLDQFNLDDALTERRNFMCSADLRDFIETYHLDLSQDGILNPREAFGSHDDSDHVYNTPRAWFMLRYFNPTSNRWDGPEADFSPVSDKLPWCLQPEKKITPEDIKYVLSSHYQGTPYDPYERYGHPEEKGRFRSIGINRNDFMALIQLRPDLPSPYQAVEWLAFASNAFNVMAPFYANVETTPTYLSNTGGTVSTDNFYWASRLIAAMADASYSRSLFHIERWQQTVLAQSHQLLHQYDALQGQESDACRQQQLRESANQAIADILQKETAATLDKVLFELSSQMKNAYSRSDA
ncbi:C69 family dipeptidase [Oscillospiraceae bacterium HV4-5-C5C]|nr:C69 family dipeptidase [Oscillospiraceae bacterium HV4-5-C5C]